MTVDQRLIACILDRRDNILPTHKLLHIKHNERKDWFSHTHRDANSYMHPGNGIDHMHTTTMKDFSMLYWQSKMQ